MDTLIIVLLSTYLSIMLILLALIDTLDKKGYLKNWDNFFFSLGAMFWPVVVIALPFILIGWLLSKGFNKIIPNKTNKNI